MLEINARFAIHRYYRTARIKYFTVNIGGSIPPFLIYGVNFMGWKTIVIKDSEKISLFLNNILIHQKNTNYRVFLADIDCLIFEDYKTLLTTRMLCELAKNNILTIICDDQFMPSAYINPIKAKFNQLEIINNQLKWEKEFKVKMWEKIVKQKINNQIDILKINQKSQEKIKLLYKYISELRDGDVTNREGHAAKIYFNELFGNHFSRSDEGIINSALNYGYSIIRSAVCRTIVAKGLHPSISLFHHNMYDAFALADDLMEPFRPIVDDYVFKNLVTRDYFGRNEKIELINLLNSTILFEGKEQFLVNAIDFYVDSIIKSFDNHDALLVRFPYAEAIKYYEL